MQGVIHRCCLMLIVIVAIVGCGGQPADVTGTPTSDVTPGSMPTAASAPTTMPMQVTATLTTARVGLTLASGCTAEGGVAEVAVTVTHVSDLYGVELHLAFDVSRLQVVDADPAALGVQIEDGTLLKVGFIPVNQADNDVGKIDYAVAQMPPAIPVSGDGVLARIRFRPLTDGAATVVLEQAVLAASDGQALPIWVEPEAVTVLVP